jgi:hypothetical protein
MTVPAELEELMSPPPSLDEDAPPATRLLIPDCALVESSLQQLILSPDPELFATNASLTYLDGLALVFLMLHENAPDDLGGLPIDGRFENVARAWVPVTDLCQVAAQPWVAAIQPPIRAAPALELDPGLTLLD